MLIVRTSSPDRGERYSTATIAKKASLKKAVFLLALTVFMISYVPRPVSAPAPPSISCGGEPDFSITASPSDLKVLAGSSNSTTLTLTSFYGFTGTINMTASAYSPDLNATLTPDSVLLPSGGSKTSVLDVFVTLSTPGGSYSVSVTASNGTLTNYISVGILVPGPDFRLSSATFFSTVARGSPATDTISVTSLNDFAGTITLDSSSSPPVATALTPPSITLAAGETKNSTLNFPTNSSTVPGPYGVSVKGTSGSLSHYTSVFIIVIGPSFELSATPDFLTIPRGSLATVAINVTSLHDFSSPVHLSATTDPSISGLSLTPSIVTPAANRGLASHLNITTSSLTYIGLHTVYVEGVSGLQTNATFLTIDVPGIMPDFNMTAAPESVTIMPGGLSSSSTITFTSIDQFADTIAVSLFCPSVGLKASLTPGNVTLTSGGTATDTLTVSADTNTPNGDYYISVDGTNGTLFHSATVFVKVATPDFGISASPPYLSITLPGPKTSTITVASILGYSNMVVIAVTSHSPELTVNCSPNTVTVSPTVNGTSVCTFSATAPGSYMAEITGNVGALSHSVVVYVLVTGPHPDFGISANPTTKGPLYPGVHGTGTITITPVNSFTGTVYLTATSSTGLSATLSPTSVTRSGTSTLDVNATVAGTYTVTVTGTSGSLVHTTSAITVNVVDFTIVASSPSTAAIGQSATSTVSVAAVNGFAGTVTFVDPPPPGLTCNPFFPANVTGSGTATLSCSSNTAGTYIVTITGSSTSGSLTHSTTPTFTFAAVPDFTITASTPTSSNAGQYPYSTITLSALNGFTGKVTLSNIPPAGLTCGLSPDNVTLLSTTTSRLTCSAATAGGYTVTVTGMGSSGTHTATATFNFKDFTISASPTAVTVDAGASIATTITITAQNGFSGIVNLTPNPSSGLTASLSPMSVTGFGPATLTVSAATTGTYTVTVAGTSDGLQHTTATVTVTVVPPPPPDFSMAATTPSTVTTGKSTSSTITVTAMNSFTGSVALSDTPLPIGLTCGSIMPSTVSLPPSPVTASLSCSAIAAGTYTVTITGTGSSGPHSATATFTYTAPLPPDFTIFASKTSMTIQAGDTAAQTITLTSLNGFTGTVSISAIASPSGPQDSLSPTSVTLGASENVTLTIAVPATVSTGAYTITVTAMSGSLSHPATVALTVTSAAPVSPQPAASTILGFDPTLFYGLVGVLVAAVAGGIGIVMWKKRSSPASSAT